MSTLFQHRILSRAPPSHGELEHYKKLGHESIALCVVVILVTTLTTALRVYSRVKVFKTFTIEDWTMCFAWLGSIAYGTLGVSVIRFSPIFGPAPTERNIRIAGQITLGVEIIYGPIIAVVKLSIITQLIRIFAPIIGSKRRYLMSAFAWFNTLWYVPVFFVSIFQCAPLAMAWDPTIKGTCVNYPVYIIIVGIYNTISDCIIFAIPLVCIWKLQMSWNKKIGVGLVFTIGAFACVTGVLRIVYSVIHSKNPAAYDSLVAVSLCSHGEITAGIICGNLPNLPALLRHWRGRPGVSSTSQARLPMAVESLENKDTSLKDIGSLLRADSRDTYMMREIDSTHS